MGIANLFFFDNWAKALMGWFVVESPVALNRK